MCCTSMLMWLIWLPWSIQAHTPATGGHFTAWSCAAGAVEHKQVVQLHVDHKDIPAQLLAGAVGWHHSLFRLCRCYTCARPTQLCKPVPLLWRRL